MTFCSCLNKTEEQQQLRNLRQGIATLLQMAITMCGESFLPCLFPLPPPPFPRPPLHRNSCSAGRILQASSLLAIMICLVQRQPAGCNEGSYLPFFNQCWINQIICSVCPPCLFTVPRGSSTLFKYSQCPKLSLCPLPLLVSVTPHQDHVDNHKLLLWFQSELSPFCYLLILFTSPISLLTFFCDPILTLFFLWSISTPRRAAQGHSVCKNGATK